MGLQRGLEIHSHMVPKQSGRACGAFKKALKSCASDSLAYCVGVQCECGKDEQGQEGQGHETHAAGLLQALQVLVWG